MNRKEFIKKSCIACLGTIAFGSLMESCGTSKVFQATVKDKQIEIPLAQFTEENKQVIVRVPELNYDILVLQKGSEYKALLLKCTHLPNPVYVSAGQISCNQHGSIFDLDGNIINGPADKQLTTYPTAVVGQAVFVTLT